MMDWFLECNKLAWACNVTVFSVACRPFYHLYSPTLKHALIIVVKYITIDVFHSLLLLRIHHIQLNCECELQHCLNLFSFDDWKCILPRSVLLRLSMVDFI